ncbi:AzlD domain-containing protein [Pseudodesulfovibrio sp. zrk46]|uniref:AzlD domain-containing protein n=1 Tax=Pseudodesulfovibrio sp. zrk46 TaxID=2725288 RepID=UPI00144A1FB4|nr:AzlD domain-containing protein [Pseudodesulfovibrio sp. zrk46]QJB56471.1 AzlD domain-containing protein [Pseudodesulfovibrio sp. zrk46]
MVDMMKYWPMVLGIGIGTFIIRYSFILIIDRVTLSDEVRRMLRFIPASVLSALMVPAVLLHKNGVTTFAGWERVLAALVAIGVAWKTRNIMATIASGMVALWGFQALM